jgi:hypothetical protein
VWPSRERSEQMDDRSAGVRAYQVHHGKNGTKGDSDIA